MQINFQQLIFIFIIKFYIELFTFTS